MYDMKVCLVMGHQRSFLPRCCIYIQKLQQSLNLSYAFTLHFNGNRCILFAPHNQWKPLSDLSYFYCLRFFLCSLCCLLVLFIKPYVSLWLVLFVFIVKDNCHLSSFGICKTNRPPIFKDDIGKLICSLVLLPSDSNIYII